MRFGARLLATVVLVLMASNAVAVEVPDLTVNRTYYDVSGRTGRALKQQMDKLGPNGFWAYTKWQVKWTAACRVSVIISYTRPRLTDRNQVPLSLRHQWDRMIADLRKHEAGHAQHGISAGAEIAQANCTSAQTIIHKWSREDKAYDARTHHGRTQGVTLND